MSSIIFLDTETDPQSHKILDMGCVSYDGKQLHSSRIEEIVSLVGEADFLCGHNFLNHDWKFLEPRLQSYGFDSSLIIDTLFLSPLLFPARPYHALLKDDKILNDELNNPLSDAIKARMLFDDEVSAFWRLNSGFRELLYLLLHNKSGFAAFFRFVEYEAPARDAAEAIGQLFHKDICLNANIRRLVSENPVETIMVSTMHKAKGKEYDNVFLMPGTWRPVDDEGKRLMYVAMTRAKSFLSIHLRGDWLDGAAFIDGLKLYSDSRKWELPDILSIQLTHKDVWLGFFKSRQRLISNLVAGDELQAVDQECRTAKGQVVLRFSRRFQETICSLDRQGYVLKDARISYVVWWKDEETGKEIRIVLPQVRFKSTK
jgi:hypothetical protein